MTQQDTNDKAVGELVQDLSCATPPPSYARSCNWLSWR